MNKTIILILLGSGSMLTMNFQCNKEVVDLPPDQIFQIPIDIFPLKKSYLLTDTIWLETR